MAPEIMRFKGEDYEKIDQNTVSKMYTQINDVIPGDIETMDLMIESKGKVS